MFRTVTKGLRLIGSAANLLTQSGMMVLPNNADKVIKKANKLISSNYISKTLTKGATESDKEKVMKDRNATYDNYVVNTNYYSAFDAAAVAHAQAVKEADKSKTRILLLHATVVIIMCVMSASYFAAALILSITFVSIYYKKQEIGSHVISIIGHSNFSTKILSVLSLILEYYNIKDKLYGTAKIIVEAILMML